jgi:hypothetical protein
VVVQGNHEVVVDRHVNKANAVLLILLKDRPLVLTAAAADHLAVDQSSIGSGRSGVDVLDARGKSVDSLVVPVSDRERAGIDIVVGSSRALNNDRANNSVTVLAREVRVVPRGAVLGSLEGVGLLLIRGNRALGDSGYTILCIPTERRVKVSLMSHTSNLGGFYSYLCHWRRPCQ